MSKDREKVRRLMVSINRIDGIWYHLARRSGVKVNMLSLLFALDDGTPRTQKQICEEWIIPKTTINTIVKECVAAGYVRLLQNGHSREKLLYLTPEGQAYAQKALRLFYQVENAAMERTLQSCSPAFIEDIGRYAENLREEAEKADAIL
ncbi:MarR family winged helix-turn-helix transcriptional regulator [Agathobaculum desmolans]|uniref:MarR family winged helix-turn-helix transcriptional regulator n=1 Tax=Agathobaculum desmolans TaxID=39484 RepID=UPI00248E9D36|nr:helix-turn-helix domain-containing protein [Agathobaculum desmolans]